MAAAAVAAIAVLAGFAGNAHAAPTPAEIEQQIDQKWQQLEPVIEEHNATRIKLKKQRAKASELAGKIAPLEAEVTLTRARVGHYAEYFYRGGELAQINSMLTSQSADEFADRLMVLDLVAQQHTARISDVIAARNKLAEAKRPLDELVAQLTKLEQEQKARQEKIEAEIKALNKLRVVAYGTSGGIGDLRPVPCPTTYPGGPTGIAIKFACAQIGKTYVWGAAGPDHYDCSGLTMAAWAKAGVSLPHNAAAQRSSVRSISRSELRPGDLVFYYSDLHHVGMYAGNGWIVHAYSSGLPVKMRRMEVSGSPIHSFGRPG